MNYRIKQITTLFCMLLVLPAWSLTAETPREKGKRIMKAIDQMPRFEKMTSDAIFKIFDSFVFMNLMDSKQSVRLCRTQGFVLSYDLQHKLRFYIKY